MQDPRLGRESVLHERLTEVWQAAVAEWPASVAVADR
jgi:hypothetical protein